MAWALELQAGINHSPLSCVSRGILSTAKEKKPRHMESAEATVAKFVLPNQESRWQEKERTVPAGTGARILPSDTPLHPSPSSGNKTSRKPVIQTVK